MVFSEADKRNMRLLATGEHRSQITLMLKRQIALLRQIEEAIAANEQWLADHRANLDQAKQNIAVIEEILSQVKA